MKNNTRTHYVTTTAMFCAIAFIAVLIGKIVPNIAGFLSYDPKDAIVVIAGFISGPLTAVLISVIVSFIEMITISGTGVYGLLMNIISTCFFAVPAAAYYEHNRNHKGAVTGLSIGVLVQTAGMLLWNYIITPFYMGVPRETVAAMLLPVFLPFNLIKGGINAGLTLLIYKPIVNALRKANLVRPSTGTKSEGGKKKQTGFTLLAAAVFVSFVLLFLVLAGII